MNTDKRKNPRRLRAAALLDRDGTLNKEVEYLHSADKFEWIPGAVEAIRVLNERGFLVIVVTNQGGIAHGYYDSDDVRILHRFMQEALAEHGARIDDFYFCPYHPDGSVPHLAHASKDRKPGTGMFDRAIIEHAIDPSRSFMVGDKETDMIPAVSLGITAILVRTGYGRNFESDTQADFVDDDIAAATRRIVRLSRTDRKGT